MKVEIVTIGDEILIGQIVDSNAKWMASSLTNSGFEIVAISSVGDNEDSIRLALDIAFSRADIVLLTGGLGPTKDDVTKHTLCDYFNSRLVFDASVYQHIDSLFSKRGISMNQLTRQQAYVPDKCHVIQNMTGTAPILMFEQEDKILVSMPGVPFEMRTSMQNDIIPLLQQRFLSMPYQKKMFLISGISESALNEHLQSFESKLPAPLSLAYLPSYGLIRLRLSVRGKEYFEQLTIQSEKLKELVTDWLIAEIEQPLEYVVGDKLKNRCLTIATAESCTGGRIAHKISSVAGASNYFKGSIVAYSNQVKENVLSVSSSTLDKQGAVSRAVVEQMAQHCAEIMGTDCAIATSGIAGPTGGSDKKPIGTVWICTYLKGKMVSKKYNTGNSREENIARATNMALLQMLKML